MSACARDSWSTLPDLRCGALQPLSFAARLALKVAACAHSPISRCFLAGVHATWAFAVRAVASFSSAVCLLCTPLQSSGPRSTLPRAGHSLSLSLNLPDAITSPSWSAAFRPSWRVRRVILDPN